MNDLEHKRRMDPASDAEVAGRLLAVAKPQPDAAREAALLDRIMAAAERSPRLVAVTAAPKAPAPTPLRAVASPATASRRLRPGRDLWTAASVLAASLVIGFVAGQTSLSQATIFTVAEASGVSFTSATHDVATTLAGAEHGELD